MADEKKVSEALQSVDIALDSYDDIFSDFDPSQYEKKVLSDDFLNELQKRYMENHKGSISVTFTLPAALRSEKSEAIIRKRIKKYFRDRLKDMRKAIAERQKQGVLRIALGSALSIGLFMMDSELQTLAALMVSPLLWYLMWSGFEAVFEAAQKMGKQKSFMEKFLKADYNFKSEEEVLKKIGLQK